MALAKDAIKSARAYLNDNAAITWTDAILMPLLQEAHGELIQDLDLNSIGVIKYQTAPIIVPAGAIDLGVSQPANIIEPISMMERSPGTDAESFVDMIKVNFLPEINRTTWLVYWSWMGQIINFLGATATREVVLRYKGFLTVPELLTDPIGVIFGERYLGPRIAALCYDIAGKNSDRLNEIAATNKYKLLQRGVLADQTPTKRRPYRSPKFVYGTGAMVSVPVGSGGGGNPVLWIAPTPAPDGIATVFTFSQLPIWISWNGLNQYRGAGYQVVSVGAAGYGISFYDVLGNLLTPGLLDVIRGEMG